MRFWQTVIAVSFFPLGLLAQPLTSSGQVEGLVIDPSGAIVAGAQVSLPHIGTGAVRSAETTDAGRIPVRCGAESGGTR